MAEAAYKSTVQNAGKNQSGLVAGWEVLGLKKEDATRIWNECAKEGFVSDREKFYKQRTLMDEDGNPIDEKAAVAKKKDEVTNGVFECGACGFTLFVATGRESKFYGSGFKCPECGAPKSKFSARDDFGEE